MVLVVVMGLPVFTNMISTMTDLELATSKPPNENISDLWLGVQKTCTQVERLRVGGVGWCWVVPGGWRWAPRG